MNEARGAGHNVPRFDHRPSLFWALALALLGPGPSLYSSLVNENGTGKL